MYLILVEVLECAVCQGSVQALDSLLNNKNIDEDITETLEKACNMLPGEYYKKVRFITDLFFMIDL